MMVVEVLPKRSLGWRKFGGVSIVVDGSERRAIWQKTVKLAVFFSTLAQVCVI